MGWFVGSDEIQFTVDDSSPGLGSNWQQMFGFADIDSDDALIAQDKSDWFIKRVLLDAYPVLTRADEISAPARIYSLAIGTIPVPSSSGAIPGSDIFTSTAYDYWRRLFRSYSRPVYATTLVGLADNDTSVVTSAGPATSKTVADSPWGPSSVHDDFEVSNAGLVHNSGLIVAASTALGPSVYTWDENDILTVFVQWRVLLQKRRT